MWVPRLAGRYVLSRAVMAAVGHTLPAASFDWQPKDWPVAQRTWLYACVVSGAALVSCTGGLLSSAASEEASSAAAAAAGTAAAGLQSDLHRLSRAEYNNSVRDLLGSALAPANQFAADDTEGGYDNNSAALTLSPPQMADYATAAEALAAELAGNRTQMAKLAPCQAANAPADCVAQFVTLVGGRAWRRPLTPDEVTAVTALATGQSGDTYAQQVERATMALLLSPYFLYRVEAEPAGSPNSASLSDYALASRLSFFLWSSMPDDTLLATAADGSLHTDAVLRAQAERMLADPKASALTSVFAAQWLELTKTAALQPDPTLFPAWNENLRHDLIAQTEAQFGDLLVGAAGLGSLLDGNQMYLNDRLAAYYGFPAVGSTTLVKTEVPSRFGLLGQGAVLAATSFPSRTSLVHRGQFVLAQLLCAPPPAAPANVPALATTSTTPTTQRQRLEAHATDASCRSCHDLMDPYGFVLEGFDAIGQPRSLDNNVAIDTSATLPDGSQVASAEQLSTKLAADARAPACFVQQLMTYALERKLTSADMATAAALNQTFVADGQRVDHLIVNFVLSVAFRQPGAGASP